MKVNITINWLNKLSKLNQTALDGCLYGDGKRVSVCFTSSFFSSLVYLPKRINAERKGEQCIALIVVVGALCALL